MVEWIDGVAGLKSSDFHEIVLSWGAQRVRVWSKDRDKNMVVLPENKSVVGDFEYLDPP